MRGVRSATRRYSVGPPTFVPGRLYGIRRWTARRGENGTINLGGHYDYQTWRSAGESTWAQCHARGGHPPGERAPAGRCTCGLYAFHPWAIRRSRFWQDKSLLMTTLRGPLDIVGIVEGWGRVHVHREGFRAEYARPTTLLLVGSPRDSDYGRLVEDLAISHRAGLLEAKSASAVENHCRGGGIGISPEAVEALISETDPDGLRVDGGVIGDD